jgi:hypothetical protein
MDSSEYLRRAKFLEDLKLLGEHEYLEILRLLIKKKVHYSENTNGVFFDVASLEKDTFDELIKFIEFVSRNQADLSARENIMTGLKSSVTTT